MAKTNNPIRDIQRLKRPSPEETVSKTSADQRVENVVVVFMLSALETLVTDFAFSAEQAKKFQNICEVRSMIKINQMK